MLPKFHILIGFILSILLHLFFPHIPILHLLIFFLSSFLFDVDHYIYFIFTKKSFNLFKSYKYFRYDLREIAIKNKIKKTKYLLLPFHLIEFLLIIFVFSIFIQFFRFIFLGIVSHIIVDWIYDLTLDKKDKKYKRVFSLLYYVISNKRSSKKIKKQRR